MHALNVHLINLLFPMICLYVNVLTIYQPLRSLLHIHDLP